jgi:hypothetical protein
LAANKLATDLYLNPDERVGYCIRKARYLYSLGSQFNFYLHEATLRVMDNAPLKPRIRQSIDIVNQCFTTIFLGLLLLGGYTLWKNPSVPFLSLLPVFYLATMSGYLVLIAEVQPRYLFSIWYIGSIYVGYLLVRVDREGPRRPSSPEQP